MFPNGPKTGKLHEPADVIFADPVGFDKLRAQSDLAGKFENRRPKMAMVDHHDPGLGRAVALDAFECAKNVDGIKDVVKQDVVESFVQLEVFGVTLNKMQIGMLAARILNHGIADFNTHTKLWPDGSKKVAGFATHVENALPRLDNELQHALERVVKVVVALNIPVALGNDRLLMSTPSIANFGKRIRSPGLLVANLNFGVDHQ